jgi:hypothetical protein
MPGPGAAAADTQERFLRAIAARIDPTLVVEVHLFSPIRQGGIESGVAVIAAAQPVVADATLDAVVDDSASSIADDEAFAPAPATDDAFASEQALARDAAGDDAASDDGAAPDNVAPDDVAPDDLVADDADDDFDAERAAPRAERFTVYTAHYRHVLKGPDRGKWEADATPEADAPLATVDAVVRGVQRRAGEALDAERLSGDAFRAAVGFESATPAAAEG